MELLREGRDRLALRRLDIVLVGITVALLLVTALLLVDPSFGFALPDRSLDVTTNSLIALAGLSLAALALARYRESGRVSGLFQSSAFLLMAWVTLINVALVVFREDARFFLTLGGPPEQSQLPFYVWAVSRIAAAALLVLGGLTALMAVQRVPRVRRALLVPVLAVSALAVLLLPLADLLPPFVGPAGYQAMLEETRFARVVPDVTPLGVTAQALATGLFLLGALLYRRSYLRNGPVLDGYLAVALVLAAFAEVHFLLFPGIYTSLVTTTDALRLAFFGVLLLGIMAESRSDLRALRSAYTALDRLRQSEAERATLEERTRLARELHDGLAQDLWFAKLKHERLVSHLPDAQRGLGQEVAQALDAAIAEARQAVVTMRAGLERERPLHELLAEAVEDFGSESGLRADFSAADLPSALPPRTQAEVLRVLQEALTNVRKHADATVVRVSAEVAGGTLVLSVIDNGRGFRPDETSGDGLGVQGMRERARLMGGDLHVVSEPSSGTGVHLKVPVAETMA
ncbi:MAG TPA: sensor histidine kinase [Candidatus Limnocylindria bacterium]|nr:sensor histidine kinase [Candidatus Limnocylindria bacterium]